MAKEPSSTISGASMPLTRHSEAGCALLARPGIRSDILPAPAALQCLIEIVASMDSCLRIFDEFL
ncbi:hypothetical protein [Erwinia amylovora]|uniref:hypothetical protein n=1 Tax=Erwinia amylovora TaxID=552 RepID=UPI0012BB669B|nr:hypothetical protein [Erwinia amylovora]